MDGLPTETGKTNDEKHIQIKETMQFQDICIVDKYYITYVTCLLLGIGSLLPYSALVSAFEYFASKHTDINIILHLSIVHNICNFLSIAFLIQFNNLISVKARIIVCSVITATTFVIIPNHSDSYASVLCIAGLCGITVGVLSVAVIAYAQLFSTKYVQVAFVGQSASALISSVLRIITKTCFSLELGAWIFFVISAVILTLGLVLYAVSLQTEFVKHSLRNQSNNHNETNNDSSEIEQIHYRDIFKKLRTPAMTIFWLYIVTCAILPLLANIKSENDYLNKDRWMTVVLTSVYAVADYFGRQFIVINATLSDLEKFAIARFVLLAIVALFYTPVWTNDMGLYVLTVVLGLSHGQFSCYGFMKYGALLKENEHEIGAAVMEFFLSMGIALSALVAWGIEKLVKGI